MSPSSRESNIIQLREALLQANTQLLHIIEDRRNLCLKIQEVKAVSGRFAHYDPERELVVFEHLGQELKGLTIKELFAFSLIMEDQAMAMAPGSYPTWSQGAHLNEPLRDIFTMINPLLLKVTHQPLFDKLVLTSEFNFLKQLALP